MKHATLRHWIYLVCFFTILGASSCEEDEVSMSANERKLINVGIWKMTKLQIGLDEVPLDACLLDNEFHFKPDNEYTMDEGATKCDPADPQAMNGEWSLTSNGSGLIVTVDGTTKITVIDDLTAISLKIHYDIGALRYEETYEPN